MVDKCGAAFCSTDALNLVCLQSAEMVDLKLGPSRSYLMAVIGSFTPIPILSGQSRFVNLFILFYTNTLKVLNIFGKIGNFSVK